MYPFPAFICYKEINHRAPTSFIRWQFVWLSSLIELEGRKGIDESQTRFCSQTFLRDKNKYRAYTITQYEGHTLKIEVVNILDFALLRNYWEKVVGEQSDLT